MTAKLRIKQRKAKGGVCVCGGGGGRGWEAVPLSLCLSRACAIGAVDPDLEVISELNSHLLNCNDSLSKI